MALELGSGLAGPGRSARVVAEVVLLVSTDPFDQALLKGDGVPPLTEAGFLRFPDPGYGRFPIWTRLIGRMIL
ncbi:hypothetical protein ACIA5G_51375 [Amycolatopsis sp. NPDC051758]|uniref:hypothetical protein n=1 Tax=Amycolatopsis sp. NPDC051758 TaxID=3363935 RepID=UPI00378B6E2D